MSGYLLNQIYHSPVAAKISLARLLFQHFGEELLEMEMISSSLQRLAELHTQAGECMRLMQYEKFCTGCSKKKGGGCCSAFMAEENDTIQLLINFLADGAETAFDATSNSLECGFLGKEGCRLRYKPMFCLNYNCRQVIAANPRGRLQRMLAATGALLQEQYRLEQCLSSILKN